MPRLRPWRPISGHSFALIQLLGPNVATLVGAAIGGTIGLLTPKRLGLPFGRAFERDDGILLVVSGLDPTQVVAVRDVIAQGGGDAVQLHFGS